jgi:hypothetical protein
MNVRSVIEEYREDEPFMERVAGVLGIVALVLLSITLLRLTGGYVFAAPQALSSPSRVSTPAHEPAEAAIFVLRISPPVHCVRLPGIEGMGHEWIRQWGDGELPPAIPTCVNARRQ